uniref:Uncharacterized protein n=1 Tax=Populus trichocarpa x Populus deltoides TaxID=3695 RepID=A9PJX2_9ROSI|nr:unknown [Populus trichocarpa x Populus deltoides]
MLIYFSFLNFEFMYLNYRWVEIFFLVCFSLTTDRLWAVFH